MGTESNGAQDSMKKKAGVATAIFVAGLGIGFPSGFKTAADQSDRIAKIESRQDSIEKNMDARLKEISDRLDRMLAQLIAQRRAEK